MESSIVQGGKAYDDRGSVVFVNDFNFVDAGIKRFYQVENYKQGFIRAWHGHKKEAKYVHVVKGSALVRIVEVVGGWDFPKVNPFQEFVLNANIPKILYIPAGYANGFKTLEADTIVQFFSTTTLEESQGDDYRFNWNYWGRWEENFR